LYTIVLLKKLALHIVVLLFCTYTNAQQASVFKTITTANGLPSNYVFCTAEDNDGFIWVGTDKGLCRYNGVVWEVWDIDNGLPGNYVNQIFSDKHNGLWLGIAEKGMFHFDIATKKLALVNQTKTQLSVGTNENGDLLFSQTDTTKHFVIDWLCPYKNPKTLKKVKEFFYEEDVVLFEDTVTKLTHCFQFKNSKANPNLQANFVRHNLSTIDINFGNYNIATVKDFLICQNWVFRFNSNPQKDTLLLLNVNTTAPAQIRYCDTKDALYVAWPNAGFYCINKETNAIEHYSQNDGLTNLNINHIFKTKDGTILVSTLGGGIHALDKFPHNRFVPKQLPVKNLQQSGNKYYGLANGTLYEFNNNTISQEVFLRKDALCFYLTNDTLLVGSFEGLHYYSFKNNKAVLKSTVPLTAGISGILPFNKQWIFSTYGNGIYATSNFATAKRYFDDFPFGNIERIIKLKNTVAAISYEHGFFICDENLNLLKQYTTANGLLSNYVTTVAEINDTLWVGGKGGVTLIANGKVIKTLTSKDGFKGKIVKYIFKDIINNIQILSDKYLHLVKQNGILYAYGGNSTTADKNDIVIEAFYDTNDYRLLLSTNKNLSVNPLGMFLPNALVSNAYFSSIEIDGKAIEIKKSFEVAYNVNSIVFKFKPVSNILFSQSQILYKLNDNEWQIASDSLTISFKKLRPGDYTLYTKTINEDGFETKPNAIITFTVNKPWWQQWWFIVLSVLGLLTIFWQLSKYANKQKYLAKLKQQQQLETERQRISRDLHDNMGAYTSALIANVQQLKSTIGENEHTQKMQTNAESILNSLRETIWVLNNKEIALQEFNDGFKNYCFKVLKNFDYIHFNAEENITINPILTAAKAIHLNKIMQEAIQNIIKHANATQINYCISDKNGIEIKISDNGSGFDINNTPTGNGMGNMQWRAKEVGLHLTVTSTPQQGTCITINTL
jgi:signal transduction histidine kinase